MIIPKQDFRGDDYEFAAGSILGMRSWGMDQHGRLHGVTHREVWLPGENVAICKQERRVPCPDLVKRASKKMVHSRVSEVCPCGCGMTWAALLSSPMTRSSMHNAPTCGVGGCAGGSHPAEPDHTFDPSCECGFWAYNEDDFTSHGDVMGVIEGYGKTSIGTKGFRAEKARIVALCRENGDRLLSLSQWLRLQQLYPGVKFYDDEEEMVAKHGGVLKQWSPVGDGFWDEPVPKLADPFGFSSLMLSWNSVASAMRP